MQKKTSSQEKEIAGTRCTLQLNYTSTQVVLVHDRLLLLVRKTNKTNKKTPNKPQMKKITLQWHTNCSSQWVKSSVKAKKVFKVWLIKRKSAWIEVTCTHLKWWLKVQTAPNHIVFGHESLKVVHVTDVKSNCFHNMSDNESRTEFSIIS